MRERRTNAAYATTAPLSAIAFCTFPGDIGRSGMRTPVALWMAFAKAAGGGTMGTSPTPRAP